MVHALNHPDHGFSLIEVLVVVAVLSVLSVGVTLSFGHKGPSEDMHAVQRFQDMVANTKRASMLERRPHAIAVSQSGVQALSRTQEASAWHLSGVPVNADMVWTIQNGFQTPDVIPYAPDAGTPARLMFLPDGRHTPFRVDILGETQRVECSSDGWGTVACQ